MLVLSRKKGERIRVGHDIIVTIVEVRGDKIRVGIDAPDEVIIHREEVYDIIYANPDASAPGVSPPVNTDVPPAPNLGNCLPGEDGGKLP